MTQQIINVGTGPDSYTGESLRTAFQKVNENFSQLYAGNIGANTGDLVFSGQTISGTIDGNIVIDPYGSGNVNIPSNLRAAGLRVGTIDNTELAVSIDNNTALITTAGRGDGNVSLIIRASTSKGSINIRADDGHMGFGAPADGYDYIFNGEIKANAFYADAGLPVGYQFTTPGGDTGMSHDYQNDIHGNASAVIIKHNSFAAAKFYDNNHTVLSGNLVVSQTGNVFGGEFTDAFVQTFANINSYAQSVFQNLNSGDLASADFIVTADNGNDSSYYGDFGVASSTYNYPGFGVIKPNDVYILAVGADITGPGSTDGANLILGSTTGNIKMFIGAPEDANVVAEINTTSFLPGANVTYSLGSADRQWKDLWLSNNTLYLNSIPISVTDNGTLVVNGNPVAGGNISSLINGAYSLSLGSDGSTTFPNDTIKSINNLAVSIGDTPTLAWYNIYGDLNTPSTSNIILNGSVTYDSTGNIYVLGSIVDFNTENFAGDSLFLKYTTTGELLWHKTWTDENNMPCGSLNASMRYQPITGNATIDTILWASYVPVGAISYIGTMNLEGDLVDTTDVARAPQQLNNYRATDILSVNNVFGVYDAAYICGTHYDAADTGFYLPSIGAVALDNNIPPIQYVFSTPDMATDSSAYFKSIDIINGVDPAVYAVGSYRSTDTNFRKGIIGLLQLSESAPTVPQL